VHQIANVMATSAREDMVTLDQALAEMVDRATITYETAHPWIEDPEKRAAIQKRYYRVTPVPRPARGVSR
jgi:Tfp pilus assembly ATPase PilU